MYGIFAHILMIFRANVGKYSSTMEHMGFIWFYMDLLLSLHWPMIVGIWYILVYCPLWEVWGLHMVTHTVSQHPVDLFTPFTLYAKALHYVRIKQPDFNQSTLLIGLFLNRTGLLVRSFLKPKLRYISNKFLPHSVNTSKLIFWTFSPYFLHNEISCVWPWLAVTWLNPFPSGNAGHSQRWAEAGSWTYRHMLVGGFKHDHRKTIGKP